jgi:hypothetical protein
MNQSGRASIITVLAIASVLLVVGLFAFSRESLTAVAGRFMTALSEGNVDQLTKMSYLGNGTEEEMRRDWELAVNTAGRYYKFEFRIVGSVQHSPDSASVRMQVVRDSDRMGSFEENYQLPLVRVGNDWKVDVRSISSQFYPALPR